MIILIELGLLLVSLAVPFVWLIYLKDSEGWKYNLLRALYGDISGLILIHSTFNASITTLMESPDYSLPSFISFFFIIPVFLDVYKTEKQREQLKKLLFYFTLGLGLLVYLRTVLWQIS